MSRLQLAYQQAATNPHQNAQILEKDKENDHRHLIGYSPAQHYLLHFTDNANETPTTIKNGITKIPQTWEKLLFGPGGRLSKANTY
eukprot:9152061-Ditylum_brightwellii.AAC.1